MLKGLEILTAKNLPLVSKILSDNLFNQINRKVFYLVAHKEIGKHCSKAHTHTLVRAMGNFSLEILNKRREVLESLVDTGPRLHCFVVHYVSPVDN